MAAANWQDLSRERRVSAVNYDMMRHPEMALFSGVAPIGETKWVPCMTAATDGRDTYIDPRFWDPLTRKEARFVICHETAHKGLRHCVIPEFKRTLKEYPKLSGEAMDYVVNALLHQADPKWEWMEPPKSIQIYLDKKYYGWSYPRVLMDLMKQCQENGGDPKKDGFRGMGGQGGGSFDEHMPGGMGYEEEQKLTREIESALRQGEILVQSIKARSAEGTGGALNVNQILERRTNWRDPLRQFFTDLLRGEDIARWSRINTRIFTATNRQVILPTLYSESVGDVGLFCDTSGSMREYYPLLFGEVARLVETVQPKKLTLLWWDTRVASVQVFTPDQYSSIRNIMQPAGGGGTTPQCAVDYVKKHNLKFQCVVWLTDGDIGREPVGYTVPQLWAVIDQERFNAQTGKTLHISSLGL